ncbi:DUF6525 family protein [Roseomonas sp. KE0001]|uniref:DUF6525 family protein n=1 Tax=Roseomonas sp. KE0001 TaxID=2479201 RepID=UPI001E3511CA|nr:DUF6525 family protein [Roseomonas sp. KE0001]
MSNDRTLRDQMWFRHPGPDWEAFDALPPAIRQRLREHAYDAWSVNALLLWRYLRRRHASSRRAERVLLRHLDHCETLEGAAFDAAYRARHGRPLPHHAAGASILRYGAMMKGLTGGDAGGDDGSGGRT